MSVRPMLTRVRQPVFSSTVNKLYFEAKTLTLIDLNRHELSPTSSTTWAHRPFRHQGLHGGSPLAPTCMIGQFEVGFTSAHLVVDKVGRTTKQYDGQSSTGVPGLSTPPSPSAATPTVSSWTVAPARIPFVSCCRITHDRDFAVIFDWSDVTGQCSGCRAGRS
jgi:hypothetical protein